MTNHQLRPDLVGILVVEDALTEGDMALEGDILHVCGQAGSDTGPMSG